MCIIQVSHYYYSRLLFFNQYSKKYEVKKIIYVYKIPFVKKKSKNSYNGFIFGVLIFFLSYFRFINLFMDVQLNHFFFKSLKKSITAII